MAEGLTFLTVPHTWAGAFHPPYKEPYCRVKDVIREDNVGPIRLLRGCTAISFETSPAFAESVLRYFDRFYVKPPPKDRYLERNCHIAAAAICHNVIDPSYTEAMRIAEDVLANGKPIDGQDMINGLPEGAHAVLGHSASTLITGAFHSFIGLGEGHPLFLQTIDFEAPVALATYEHVQGELAERYQQERYANFIDAHSGNFFFRAMI